MSSDEYYRQQAKDAQQLADKAQNDGDRASWLRIAQSWLSLLSKGAPTASEQFDDDAKRRGTGQDDSESSH